MNLEAFVEHIRQEIREEGFIPSVQLAGVVVRRLHERELLDKFSAARVLEHIEGGDIHRVEYTNTQSLAINRYKDLYYYNPEPE